MRVVYRRVVTFSQDKPEPLWLSKTVTFPVYKGISSMGECVSVLLKDVERIEVRWLKQVVPQ